MHPHGASNDMAGIAATQQQMKHFDSQRRPIALPNAQMNTLQFSKTDEIEGFSARTHLFPFMRNLSAHLLAK